MCRSPSSALLALLVGCGPAHVFHKDPERGCKDITLAGQDDVAAAAGCSAVDSITLRTGMALDLSPLGRLVTIRGALSVGPSVGFTELNLPRLSSVGAVRVVGNGNLQGIYLPQLARAAKVEIEGNTALTTISLPKLTAVDTRIAIVDNAALVVVNLSTLATAKDVAIKNNPKLTIIEGQHPALQPNAAAPPPTTP